MISPKRRSCFFLFPYFFGLLSCSITQICPYHYTHMHTNRLIKSIQHVSCLFNKKRHQTHTHTDALVQSRYDVVVVCCCINSVLIKSFSCSQSFHYVLSDDSRYVNQGCHPNCFQMYLMVILLWIMFKRHFFHYPPLSM